VYGKILEKLQEGYNVYVTGHSYGGAIAGKVAELLNDAEEHIRIRIHIATTGSIYIPKTARVNNVDIVHYMHVHDISLRCNELQKKVNHKNKRIIWFQKVNDKSKSPHMIAEWKHHNDNIYDHLQEYMLYCKKTVLPDAYLENLQIKILTYKEDFVTPNSASSPSPSPVCIGPSCGLMLSRPRRIAPMSQKRQTSPKGLPRYT